MISTQVRPRVARFEVRLTDGEACAPGAAELDTDAKMAAARARVYEELRRTLKPRLQAELGGEEACGPDVEAYYAATIRHIKRKKLEGGEVGARYKAIDV